MKRRDLLRAGFHSLVLIPAGALVACGGRVTCTDTTGLDQADIDARAAQNYLDTAPDPDKFCSVCDQFQPAPKEDACGGCKVLKGPIHPKGTCKLFVKKG
jgi:hypothetical protein